MSAGQRDDILGAVRRAATDRGLRAPEAVDTRIAARAANVIPVRGGAGDQLSLATFVEEAGLAGAEIERAAGLMAVPAVLSHFLQHNKMPGNLRVASGPLMSRIPWAEDAFLQPESGGAQGRDPVGVSVALAGIAETGTVMMASSRETPAMLNLLPLLHVVLLPESRVVGNYEQTLDLVRDNMPRVVTYITGPSRTADIELELLMGAHGPQRLLIVLVEGT